MSIPCPRCAFKFPVLDRNTVCIQTHGKCLFCHFFKGNAPDADLIVIDAVYEQRRAEAKKIVNPDGLDSVIE